MNENHTNKEELEITAEAVEPKTEIKEEIDAAPVSEEIDVATVVDEQPSIIADYIYDELDKKAEIEKKIKSKAKTAKTLGLIVTIVSAIRAVAGPILAIMLVLFDLLVFAFLMMGGALMLAMSVIVLPFLPLILILLGVVIAVVIVVLEFLPIILGVVSVILSASAKKSIKKHGLEYNADCKKAVSDSKVMSIIGLIVSIVAEPFAILPTLVLSLPVVFFVIIAVVFMLQLLGAPIGV